LHQQNLANLPKSFIERNVNEEFKLEILPHNEVSQRLLGSVIVHLEDGAANN